MSAVKEKEKAAGGASESSAKINPEGSTKTKPAKPKPRQLPPYHVILLDDNDHSHEYVIEMMVVIFGFPIERGFQIADQVHRNKKAIVLTTHKELAELKRDQIHAYGADVRVATCAGSMSAIIVAAE